MPDTTPTLGDRLSDRLTDSHTDTLTGQPPALEETALEETDRAIDATFERLLTVQRRFENRVRWAALVCWSVVLSTLVTSVASIGVIRNGAGSSVEWARMILLGAGLLGGLALFGALLTSFHWLFRSQTPTLRAIERRLATLEERLRASEPPSTPA